MKKNKIMYFLLFMVFFLSGCGPDRQNPDVICLNETCDIYINNEHTSVVKYDDCSILELEDDSNNILIKEKITFTPIISFNVKTEDFMLALGYETYEANKKMYYSNDELNEKENQFDIFEQTIDEETTYVFCFVVPKEKNGFTYNQVGISFLVFNNYSLVYKFD